MIRFIGMDWWGVGPREMARSMREAGVDASFAIGADLGSRIDRNLIRLAPGIASVRWHRRMPRPGRGDTVVMATPHRMTPAYLRRLKQADCTTVVLLGDEPTGSRQVHAGLWDLVDRVAVADPAWRMSIPGDRPVVIVPWGSTFTEADLIALPPRAPALTALRVVGAPYAERRDIVDRLVTAGLPVEVQGDGWTSAGVPTHPRMTRLETAASLRVTGSVVLNIHSTQFTTGLNPQTADYRIAGIEQIVMRPKDGGWRLASASEHLGDLSRDIAHALGTEIVYESALERAPLSFVETMERVLE